MTTPYVGEIQLFGFNFAPRQWAFCNGATLSVAQNTALFSLLGTTYGGNGQTTFQLPNLVGRTACNQGHGPGLTPRRMGETFGENELGLQSTQIPMHSHGLTLFKSPDSSKRAAAPGTGYGVTFPVDAATKAFAAGAGADAPFADQSIGASGGGQPHENRQPYLAVNFCIALTGVYPSFG